MQVGPVVGEGVLIGLWGTEVSVSKQELEGRLSCTSSRCPGHLSAGAIGGDAGWAGTLIPLFLGRGGAWSVSAA